MIKVNSTVEAALGK